MPHLIVFDIDGTLTHTNDVDDRCYVQVLSEYLNATIDDNWACYRHVTDFGIATELFERHRRPLSDLSIVKQRFIARLMETMATTPNCCREISGAARFLDMLRTFPDVMLGLATGGWAESAYAKLRHAGIDADGLAFASADDSMSRTEIMQICLQRATTMANVDRFNSVTYFGDGAWDAKASAELHWDFIGIASGEHADQLRALETRYVFTDFTDITSIISALKPIFGPARQSIV